MSIEIVKDLKDGIPVKVDGFNIRYPEMADLTIEQRSRFFWLLTEQICDSGCELLFPFLWGYYNRELLPDRLFEPFEERYFVEADMSAFEYTAGEAVKFAMMRAFPIEWGRGTPKTEGRVSRCSYFISPQYGIVKVVTDEQVEQKPRVEYQSQALQIAARMWPEQFAKGADGTEMKPGQGGVTANVYTVVEGKVIPLQRDDLHSEFCEDGKRCGQMLVSLQHQFSTRFREIETALSRGRDIKTILQRISDERPIG